MRLEQDQTSHPRLLRKPTLGEVSATTHIKAQKKIEQPKGSRFVGATHLDDGLKARIGMALKDASIGDDIGRQIFIGALEYQISAFAHRLEYRSEPEHRTGHPSSAVEKTLQAIVEAARALSALLRQLPDSAKTGLTKALAAQDELGRGYDERYLWELGCEIDRLEHACTAAVDAAGPEAPESDGDSSREFVAKLAEIFAECFEMQATAQEDGPFRASLIVLGEVTGLVIGHEPEFLAQILTTES